MCLLGRTRVDTILTDPPYNIGLSYDRGIGGKQNYGGVVYLMAQYTISRARMSTVSMVATATMAVRPMSTMIIATMRMTTWPSVSSSSATFCYLEI